MERITQFSINNSRATILAIIFIVILGVQTFVSIPSQEDPEITIRDAKVTAYFPGMPTHQIEDLIAKPLEKKIKELTEVEDITTTVKTGEVVLTPSIHDRYFDLAPIWQKLRNKMDDSKAELPEGTSGPFVNDDFGRVSVVTIAMTGRDYNMKEMRDVAIDLQDEINSMKSVSKVDLMGIQQERIYIEVNAARLSQYGFAFSELINQLTNQNVVSPGGLINADGSVIAVEPSGNFESVDDIKNIQVKVPGHEQVIYLQDIANVRRSYVEPSQYAAFYNDKQAIILAVSMVPRYNIENFGVEIDNKVEQLKQDLPVGLRLDYVTYQPKLVKKAVENAVNNLYQTIAVVLLVVIAFLGLRIGLIVSAIVPLTIMMSFIAMGIWGIDLQRMSIAAIIISLGLLVDNGIVIAEDMQSRISKGEDKKQAAILATKSLGLPLLTSSLTTILAFMPLMLANDATGEYLRSLSQVVIVTLLSSWFLSMFATPVLCYWFLQNKNDKKQNDEQNPQADTQKENDYKSALYTVYRKILEILLNFRIGFVVLMVALLVASVLSLSKVPKQMMPYSDRNQFLITLDLPASSHIDKTQSVTRRLTSWLSDKSQNPDIKSNAAYIGYGGPRFFLALSPPNAADNVAFIVVNTSTAENVLEISERVDAYITENLPEAKGRSKRMSLGAAEIGLVEYRVIGSDVATLYSLGAAIEDKMNSIKGSVGVANDWNEPVIRMEVNIDQNRARRAGVTSKSIASSLSAYLDGIDVGDYREGDKIIPIIVRGDATRNNWSELRVLPVMSETGEPVLLTQVADFDGYISPNSFTRVNQERTMTISGKHRFLQATDFHNRIWPFIEELPLPEGYRIEIGGEVESSEGGNSALAENLPFALIGIIILLVLQFNSFRRPAIIMLTIPLVIIGAVLGLLVSGAFFSFTALLGIYSLVGIIVNNGIVLIDCIDVNRSQGRDLRPAIIEACLARLRPILMTTLTTILGLIPIALFGGALWFPMAVVIMGGLAIGSLLTLGFVPVLYSLFFHKTAFGDQEQA